MEMTRRQAVLNMALLMGASVIGPRLLSADFGALAKGSPTFSADEIALLDEIADTIIPPTAIPGAKAAKVGAFIALIVQDCLPATERKGFAPGLASLMKAYQDRFGHSFKDGKPADRLVFLNEVNREVPARGPIKGDDGRAEMWRSFRTLKQFTIVGYFTSEIGSTQALRFEEVPGRFEGSADYRRGDRNWYTEVRG